MRLVGLAIVAPDSAGRRPRPDEPPAASGHPATGRAVGGRAVPRPPNASPAAAAPVAASTAPASAEPPAPPADTWTVRRVLEWTTQHLKKHGSESPRLDAEVLLAHARGCKRIELYTAYDDPLSDEIRAQMRGLVQRRANHEPVSYLVGHREFFSLDFVVSSAVLIPRPDTESLVMEALDRLRPLANPRVLDLCTGSGCVAVAIAKNVPAAQVLATDISAEALAVAKQNVARHGLEARVRLEQGDLFTPATNEGPFDAIVSNPPYIPTAELATLSRDVRDHEPQLALDGGGDGLDIIRRIVRGAATHLQPGGWLMFEITPEQHSAAMDLLSNEGCFNEIGARRDLGQTPRVIRARRIG